MKRRDFFKKLSLATGLIPLSSCKKQIPWPPSSAAAGHFFETEPFSSQTTQPALVSSTEVETTDWKINLAADDVNNQIRGYASRQSVCTGETIDFYITVNPQGPYDIEIFRIGHYSGSGAKKIHTATGLQGINQAGNDLSGIAEDPASGRIECDWSPSYSLPIDSTWPTGFYIARLTNTQSYQSTIIFCVRNKVASAPILCVQPTLTYQAYNGYPRIPPGTPGEFHLRGRSLYTDGIDLSTATSVNPASGSYAAVSVSYNRPYTQDDDSLCIVGGGARYDRLFYEPYFIYWAEQNGYQVDYVADTDIDAFGIDLLEQYRLIVFPGHFEYVTKNIRDAIEEARNQNVRLAFLGANAVFWQVRLEISNTGANTKNIVAYKEAIGNDNAYKDVIGNDDGIGGTYYHSGNYNSRPPYWRTISVARDDFRICGAGYLNYRALSDANLYPFSIENAAHWIWLGSNNGANVTEGTLINGLVGYEADSMSFGSPPARSNSHVALGSSQFSDAGIANASHYHTYKGGGVFAAGTMLWSWGLFDTPDMSLKPRIGAGSPIQNTAFGSPIVQGAMRNIVDEAVSDTRPRARRPSIAKKLSDQSTWVCRMQETGWAPPESLGGSTADPPAFVFHSNGDADVFVTGLSNTLFVSRRINSAWQPWTRLSNDWDIAGGPSAVLAESGGIAVGVLSPSRKYFLKYFTDDAWGAWINLDGDFLTTPTLSASGDMIDVFGIASTNDVKMRSVLYGTPASDWISLGGECVTAPVAIAKDGHGTRMLAVIGDNESVWVRIQDAATGIWGAWTDLGITTKHPPAIISPAVGRFDVAVHRHPDHSLQTITWIDGQWSPWLDHAGEISDAPTLTAQNGWIYAHCLGAALNPILWRLSIDTGATGQPGTWAQPA